MSELDRTMPCLCCDKVVLLRSSELAKMEVPVAFCKRCYANVPWSVSRVIFLLRSLVTCLTDRVEKAELSIKRLFTLFEDIEAALVEKPETEALDGA